MLISHHEQSLLTQEMLFELRVTKKLLLNIAIYVYTLRPFKVAITRALGLLNKNPFRSLLLALRKAINQKTIICYMH